jgi:hypothetical protein
MCGKTATYNLKWSEVYDYAAALTPPPELPPDPANRVNISPSRLRRKSEPDSMVWETLPVIHSSEQPEQADRAAEAIWPFLPAYSEGRLPTNRQGRTISTANARLAAGALRGIPYGRAVLDDGRPGAAHADDGRYAPIDRRDHHG